ncbi:MAG: TraB/GumN family protein [Pseudomonadales bacterium]|nr:TraB/GumN family protein [Pseudomonadales bacterium]MCP5357903.1 TraB/GumN family protein [Pseudomonadales bacterium]
MSGYRQFRVSIAAVRGLLMFACALWGAHGWAESAVWQASSGEQKIYLGGTVHLLRPSDYPLPEPFETAYQNSDELYFETDVAGLNDFAVQARMLQALTYTGTDSLRTVLDDEAYQALANHLATTGMPIQMLEKFKPGLLVSTLQVMEFQKMGFTPQGVDTYFSARAIGDGKAVGELEPIDAQIDFIARMGEGKESEFVRLSLEDLEDIPESMAQMIDAWRRGDNETLATLFVNDMKVTHPDLYDTLLVQRNNAWMQIIEPMFRDDDTEFVLVGAAHLVGEDGLLSQLQAKGYTLTQLP